MRWLASHLRAHALIFDPQPRSTHPPAAGGRLLAVYLVLDVLLGPRLALPTLLGIPLIPIWIRILGLLAVAVVLVRLTGARLADIGLYGWHQWSGSEKSYLVQIVPLALGVFTLVTIGQLRALPIAAGAVLTLVSYFVWGFYQELVYRGILQTELTRRWTPVGGMLLSNVAYTFGPFHFYYWSTYSGAELAVMFGAVFAIGLYFAVLFHRSGNVWLPGVLHGIGDVFLTGLRSLA